jgi:hypothetical protein
MEELMKELLKKMLIDNLEIKIEKHYDPSRVEVSLTLFGEVISSDYFTIL